MVYATERRLVAILVLSLGVLQSFDSGIRHATAGTMTIVGLALALPAAAFWLSPRPAVHMVAAAAGLVLTAVARMTSDVPLPTLTLAAWFPAVAAIACSTVRRRAESQ